MSLWGVLNFDPDMALAAIGGRRRVQPMAQAPIAAKEPRADRGMMKSTSLPALVPHAPRPAAVLDPNLRKSAVYARGPFQHPQEAAWHATQAEREATRRVPTREAVWRSRMALYELGQGPDPLLMHVMRKQRGAHRLETNAPHRLRHLPALPNRTRPAVG